jgi:tetratricopeptide (TPR) repeat protein
MNPSISRTVLAYILTVGLLVAACSCARTPEQKANKFLSNGKALADKKEYARAILEFKNAAKLQPKNAEVFYQLGQVYLDLGDYRTGVALLRHAASLDPKHQATQLKLAQLISGSGRSTPDALKEAEKRASDILAVSPGNPDVLSTLALAEIRLGKIEGATKHLQEALARFPAHLNAAKTLALVRLGTNDLSGAEQVLKDAVAQAPKAPEPQTALARFYLVVHRTADAEKAFRHAAELGPKDAQTLLALGEIQMALQHYDQADQTFRHLAALPGRDYRAVHAIYLWDRGKPDEAIKEFERLAKQDPNDRLTTVRLIRAYADTRRFPEAQRSIDAALKRNPTDTGVLVERSKLYLASARLREAEQDLKEILRREPRLAIAHFLLSKVHQFSGNEATRRQELIDAVKSDPQFLAARLELAQSLTASGAGKAALEYLDQALPKQKRLPALIAARNWALFATGDKVALRKSIDEGLAIQRTHDLVLQDGYLRLQGKDFQGARQSLKAVLQASAEDTRALDALGKSYLAENKPAAALAAVVDYAGRYPNSAPVQYTLATWFQRFNRRKEAKAALAAALRTAPEFVEAKLKMADFQIAEGKLDDARRTLASINTAVAGKISVEIRLAMMEERPGGNPQVALEHYRKVLAADPNNIEALNNLAFHLSNDNKEFAEALKIAQQAKELAPNSPFVDDTIGWIYYNKGLYESAVKYLDAAFSRQPNARRAYHLSMAYMMAGDTVKARTVLLAARKMDATLPEAAMAQQLITSAAIFGR